MDINSVIMLGHSPKQPLMSPPSELTDGLEPHGHMETRRCSGAGVQHGAVGREVYPGWYSWWVPGGVVYRVPTQPVI